MPSPSLERENNENCLQETTHQVTDPGHHLASSKGMPFAIAGDLTEKASDGYGEKDNIDLGNKSGNTQDRTSKEEKPEGGLEEQQQQPSKCPVLPPRSTSLINQFRYIQPDDPVYVSNTRRPQSPVPTFSSMGYPGSYQESIGSRSSGNQTSWSKGKRNQPNKPPIAPPRRSSIMHLSGKLKEQHDRNRSEQSFHEPVARIRPTISIRIVSASGNGQSLQADQIYTTVSKPVPKEETILAMQQTNAERKAYESKGTTRSPVDHRRDRRRREDRGSDEVLQKEQSSDLVCE